MMIIPILLTFFANAFTLNQEGITEAMLTNHVFDERIKTVQLYKEGWNLSYPVIKLNSDEKLMLHFDSGNDIDDFTIPSFIVTRTGKIRYFTPIILKVFLRIPLEITGLRSTPCSLHPLHSVLSQRQDKLQISGITLS